MNKQYVSTEKIDEMIVIKENIPYLSEINREQMLSRLSNEEKEILLRLYIQADIEK